MLFVYHFSFNSCLWPPRSKDKAKVVITAQGRRGTDIKNVHRRVSGQETFSQLMGESGWRGGRRLLEGREYISNLHLFYFQLDLIVTLFYDGCVLVIAEKCWVVSLFCSWVTEFWIASQPHWGWGSRSLCSKVEQHLQIVAVYVSLDS